MFGPRYFGGRYFGVEYFGHAPIVPVDGSYFGASYFGGHYFGHQYFGKTGGVAIGFNPAWAMNSNQYVGPVSPQPETH